MRGKKCIRLQCRGGQGLRVKEGSIWRKELTEKKESTIKFFEQIEVWTFLNIIKNVDFFDDTHASDDEQYQEAHNYSSKIAGLLESFKERTSLIYIYFQICRQQLHCVPIIKDIVSCVSVLCHCQSVCQ